MAGLRPGVWSDEPPIEAEEHVVSRRRFERAAWTTILAYPVASRSNSSDVSANPANSRLSRSSAGPLIGAWLCAISANVHLQPHFGCLRNPVLS